MCRTRTAGFEGFESRQRRHHRWCDLATTLAWWRQWVAMSLTSLTSLTSLSNLFCWAQRSGHANKHCDEHATKDHHAQKTQKNGSLKKFRQLRLFWASWLRQVQSGKEYLFPTDKIAKHTLRNSRQGLPSLASFSCAVTCPPDLDMFRSASPMQHLLILSPPSFPVWECNNSVATHSFPLLPSDSLELGQGVRLSCAIDPTHWRSLC